jgi:hypothetical protein
MDRLLQRIHFGPFNHSKRHEHLIFPGISREFGRHSLASWSWARASLPQYLMPDPCFPCQSNTVA